MNMDKIHIKKNQKNFKKRLVICLDVWYYIGVPRGHTFGWQLPTISTAGKRHKKGLFAIPKFKEEENDEGKH